MNNILIIPHQEHEQESNLVQRNDVATETIVEDTNVDATDKQKKDVATETIVEDANEKLIQDGLKRIAANVQKLKSFEEESHNWLDEKLNVPVETQLYAQLDTSKKPSIVWTSSDFQKWIKDGCNLDTGHTVEQLTLSLSDCVEYNYGFFSLKRNQIPNPKKLPKELYYLTGLKVLICESCNLCKLSDKLFVSLVNLEKLVVNKNFLCAIPAKIGLLKNLVYFSCSTNVIDKLPSQISQLTNLEFLCIGNNKFQKISNKIKRLIKLKLLSCPYTYITGLPVGIEQLTNLYYLNCSHNDNIKYPKNKIYYLNCSHNDKLKYLIENPEKLVNLKIFEL
jgi:Leucine-rich repeat (LRR) protein